MRHQNRSFNLGLSNQQPIERVSVQRRERLDSPSMIDSHRQCPRPTVGYQPQVAVRGSELPQRSLD
jgi:hypothetical protein